MNELPEAEAIHNLLDHLIARKWLTRWTRNGEAYALEWTPLGQQRREWLRTITAELDIATTDLPTLFSLCHLDRE